MRHNSMEEWTDAREGQGKGREGKGTGRDGMGWNGMEWNGGKRAQQSRAESREQRWGGRCAAVLQGAKSTFSVRERCLPRLINAKLGTEGGPRGRQGGRAGLRAGGRASERAREERHYYCPAVALDLGPPAGRETHRPAIAARVPLNHIAAVRGTKRVRASEWQTVPFESSGISP
ncbi:hypothetical protein AXG93_4324s1490 [Marchantia polymorpha subsp. ruderalis]|uniref:Uncharacterized protein n=1 Tax=Marchantia polymorpha subsp. ruderalis TaxID=1480154 RepID=A0A176W1E6_MARPO|nr:hypothetical protein AXG93_4324s1490 [Marchantia polymorpha subsp. ruderalis]